MSKKLHFTVAVALTAVVLVAALATPISAALAAPEAQDLGDFCKGLKPLIFSPENPLPGTAPCGENVTRFTLVEPWRAGCEGDASDPDCNVGFELTASWSEIRDWLVDKKFDRGSVWARPKAVAAPPTGATPGPESTPVPTETPPIDGGGFDWLKACLLGLLILALIGLLIYAVSLYRQRHPAAPRPTAPPAEPAP